MVLHGQLHTRLDHLFPAMAPVLASFYPVLSSTAGLQGELSSQWQAKLVDNQWQLTGKASITSLGGQWGKATIPSSVWQGTYQLIANQITSQSNLKTFGKKVRVDLITQHDLRIGQGQTRFKLIPVDFDTDNMRLGNILKGWSLPFDLTHGQVSAFGTIAWKKQLQVDGQLVLNDLGGHYKDVSFEGVQGTLDLVYADGIKTHRAVPLTVKFIDVGFPIHSASITFALSPKAKRLLPVINVKNFEAFMLGGRSYGGPFNYDLYRDKNAFVVQLEGLAVHDLIALERQEELAGDGLLDGSVPIEINNGNIVINEGTLSARKPGGTIKYTPTAKVAALAKSNTSVGLVVKALSNFNYDVLDVKTDYLASGDMHLKVRLQGHNPDWQEGQPINLNLNLQENVPALLRSLQLGSELSEKVKKRMQEKSDKAR
jgi:hypothetical protein